ncbi:hypothetical protein PSCICJ_04290 [Pseudomonas cichorii]|nr:hypothetical protein PSCICJ_04290 [Pseudomonas cichorii]
MILFRQPQARLSHVITVRHRRWQRVTFADHEGLHFMTHHFKRRVIEHHMVEHEQHDPAPVALVMGAGQTHQRSLSKVEAVMLRRESLTNLLCDVAVCRIQLKGFHHQLRLAPDYLHRAFQSFPEDRSTQGVVTINDLLQGRGKGLDALLVPDGKGRLQDVRIALDGGYVVVKNARLQRCQRVDILNIGRTARHTGHDAVQFRLVETNQWQQLRCDVRTARFDQVGRNHHFAVMAHGGSQRSNSGLTEQNTHIRRQSLAAHALDQGNGQQRVATQFEEVIVTTYALDLQHFSPDLRQGGFGFANRCFVATADQGLQVRGRECLAVQLAVRGQGQFFQMYISGWHHVFRQLALQVRFQGFQIDFGNA